jgi:RNA polymerase sigma-70 factor (ECF subfamily)
VKPEDLASALLAAQPHLEGSSPELGAAVESLVARASAEWPGVVVDPASFAAYVGERLPPSGDLLAQLAAVDAPGLYLACACARGAEGAIERFASTVIPEVDRTLAKMAIDRAQREDVVSKLEQLLFFGDGSGAPPIVSSYTGRGTLRAWARSVAVKQALTVRRKDQRQVPIDDELLELAAEQTTPEMAYLRDFYVQEFRAALARAMRAVSRRERNLLRQHYLDGMSLEAVARVHRVHRATAARWLADARESVLRRTKEELTGAIHASPSELESVLAFVRRQSTLGEDMAQLRDVLDPAG